MDDHRRPPPDRVRSIVEWVAVVVGALVVALVVKTFLFQAFYIPSASMEPTLEEGDRVLVNKLSYDLHDVNRGDIVVFEPPPDEVGPDGIKDLIKRVIGLPGRRHRDPRRRRLHQRPAARRALPGGGHRHGRSLVRATTRPSTARPSPRGRSS